jgi:uncharacterized protein YyaL (SSP411 family)
MRMRRTLESAALCASLLAGCAAPASTPTAASSTDVVPCDGRILWDTWSPETFARAKAEKKLILVDVVAEWCHWCHVMDKTTYVDARVVGAVCGDYVAIRVNSDERPDVAERYRDWGWPATAILSPDAKPVLERRGYQEPDEFAELLRTTAEDFRAGKPVARETPTRRTPTDAEFAKIAEVVGAQLDSLYDSANESWGRRQKYPVAAPVEREFLLAWRAGEERRKSRALATLDKERKLLDPVWGGMYQYSTNGDWDHPHFEKIVPVQAGAIANYAQAFAATGDKTWLDDAKQIQRYVRDFLTAPDGGFYASQDADLVTHDDPPQWVDGHDFYPLDDADRRAKGIPRIDKNVYADRNGMLIQSLCALYEASRDADALNAARKAALRVAKSHAAAIDGLTHVDATPGASQPVLHLADQVEMGRAYLALAQATGDAGMIARADALAQTLRDRFEDKTNGGFFASSVDERAIGVLPPREKPFEENARAARFLVRLHHFTGEELWTQSAQRALRFFADEKALAEEGRVVGDYAIALDELANPPLHMNVVGRPGTKETNALYAAALAVYAPGRMVKFSAPGEEYPDIGKSAVYVCSDKTCSSPVTYPAKLAEEVKKVLEVGK